jgi:hypothetical protein
MKRSWWSVLSLLGASLLVGCSAADSGAAADPSGAAPQPPEKPRNPFGVKLEPVPDDDEVKEFAKKVRLAGGDRDDNAAPWVRRATAGKAGALDGDWSGRWRYHGTDKPWVTQTEPTKVATRGNRVYVLFTYHEGAYLIVALRDGNRLAGRFMGLAEPKDTGPWAGVIVDDERIDGAWQGPAGAGRWDLRRSLRK